MTIRKATWLGGPQDGAVVEFNDTFTWYEWAELDPKVHRLVENGPVDLTYDSGVQKWRAPIHRVAKYANEFHICYLSRERVK